MNALPPSTQQPAPPGAGTSSKAATIVHALLDQIGRAVVGKRQELTLILSGLLANGHVLLDDVPGVAKTLTARSLAAAAGMSFRRIQFTPDVLPSDITGIEALDLATNEPIFRPGPIFAQLVLADEINRAPAKTQAAMLEGMQERRVTIDNTTHELPDPFLVIATQNPVDSEGTYPLPEAQLDRFVLRTKLGYPAPDAERELLRRRIARRHDEVAIEPVLTSGQFAELIAAVESVQFHDVLIDYVNAIVGATRTSPELQLGASPRGGLAITQVARANALIQGRDFATPDDVRRVAVPCLSHRVILTDEAWARRVAPEAIVTGLVNSIPAPSWQ